MHVGKDKKYHDEKLQELRTKHHDRLRYRKRVQEELEAAKELKDYENRKAERNSN